MKQGDIVQFIDPRWKSEKVSIKGVVTGFYHPDKSRDLERARVLTEAGHEWLLRVNELEILNEEQL